MIVTDARQSWLRSNKDLERKQKIASKRCRGEGGRNKGYGLGVQSFAQSFLQARTCLTSASPSTQSRNVGGRNAGADYVPGGILVGEDLMKVPGAQPDIAWWESCCFHNGEPLDILLSLTN